MGVVDISMMARGGEKGVYSKDVLTGMLFGHKEEAQDKQMVEGGLDLLQGERCIALPDCAPWSARVSNEHECVRQAPR